MNICLGYLEDFDCETSSENLYSTSKKIIDVYVLSTLVNQWINYFIFMIRRYSMTRP